jgi:hypothetical protein
MGFEGSGSGRRCRIWVLRSGSGRKGACGCFLGRVLSLQERIKERGPCIKFEKRSGCVCMFSRACIKLGSGSGYKGACGCFLGLVLGCRSGCMFSRAGIEFAGQIRVQGRVVAEGDSPSGLVFPCFTSLK